MISIPLACALFVSAVFAYPKPGDASEAREQFKVTRVTPEYWRITIDHPPYNIYGPEAMPQLNSVITEMEHDRELKVVVFDSAVPGFFLTHYDFVPPLEVTTSMRLVRPGCRRYPICWFA